MPYTTMDDKAGTIWSPDADVRLDHPGRTNVGQASAEPGESSARAAGALKAGAGSSGSGALARGKWAEREADRGPFRLQPFNGLRLAQTLRTGGSPRPRGPRPAATSGAATALARTPGRDGWQAADEAPALGQGQARHPRPTEGLRGLGLDGRPHPDRSEEKGADP